MEKGGCKNMLTIVFTHMPATNEAEDKRNYLIGLQDICFRHPCHWHVKKSKIAIAWKYGQAFRKRYLFLASLALTYGQQKRLRRNKFHKEIVNSISWAKMTHIQIWAKMTNNRKPVFLQHLKKQNMLELRWQI